MKFKSKKDELQFKLTGLNEKTIRKRLTLADKFKITKDHKASRKAKDNWRRNKYKIKKGMMKWHKSTAGKRFHKALGRFNALREKRIIDDFYINQTIKPVKISYDMITDGLLSLSSIETHLLLELQYYEPDFEALQEYLYIIRQFMNDVYNIKKELLNSYMTGTVNSDTYVDMIEIIQLFLDPKSYLYIKRDQKGLSNDINSEDGESLKEQLEKINSFEKDEPMKLYESIDKIVSE